MPRGLAIVVMLFVAASVSGQVAPDGMAGLDLSGLSEPQRKLALSLLNENSCDCGCGMKVAVCRRDDAKCGRSLDIGKQVIDLAKQGKSRDEIVKLALTPPSKFVEFQLAAGNAPSIGPARAKVTILHYFDYQCPFCQRVLPTLEQVAKDYPKDVRIVFKMHPLGIHPNSIPAAEAALAAGAQGKFLEMHRKLFERQSELTRETFVALARELGLDVGRFTKDLDAHTYLAAIEKEGQEMEAIGATGTPASFINGRFLSGAKPYTAFKEMIDEELGWAKAASRPPFKTGKNVSEASARAAAPAGPDPNKVYDIAAGTAPFRGSAKARVTILHYLDYQCPYCRMIGPTLDKILADYPNDVRVVYKMHPLSIHANAMIAAEAAMAAHAQGKFSAMHEKLLADSSALSREKVVQIATEIGLDVPRFTKDLDGHAQKASIDAQIGEVMSIGATGTPASFVNGRYVSGALAYDGFKSMIDAALAKPLTK